jgi:hypothetical protein
MPNALRSAAVPGSVSPRGRQLQRLVGHRLVKLKCSVLDPENLLRLSLERRRVPSLEPQRPPRARPSCRPFDRRTRLRGEAASTTSDRPALQRWRQLATGLNAIRLLPQRTWLAANCNHLDPCPKPSCPWPYHCEQPGGQRHSIEARPALSHRPLQHLELNAALLQERGLAATSTRTLGRPSLERAGLGATKHASSTPRLQNPQG